MIHHDYSNNPLLNTFISVMLASIGSALNHLKDVQIPTVIMQSFQLLAWFSAFVIMLVTLYKTFKQKEKNKEE